MIWSGGDSILLKAVWDRILKYFVDPSIEKHLPTLKEKWKRLGRRKKIGICVSGLFLCTLLVFAYII